jgi:hypothetical protein
MTGVGAPGGRGRPPLRWNAARRVTVWQQLLAFVLKNYKNPLPGAKNYGMMQLASCNYAFWRTIKTAFDEESY